MVQWDPCEFQPIIKNVLKKCVVNTPCMLNFDFCSLINLKEYEYRLYGAW